MSTNTPSATTPTWLVVLGVAALMVLAWAFFAARGAGSLAADNQALLLVADLEAELVAGGPERFPDRFAEAMDDVDEDAEAAGAPIDDLRWATLVVANDGRAEAEDVTATARFAADLDPVLLADLASFGSVDAEVGEEGLVMDLADIGEGETALVFLGFAPSTLSDEVADEWAGGFEGTVDRVRVEADGVADLYYGEAYR